MFKTVSMTLTLVFVALVCATPGNAQTPYQIDIIMSEETVQALMDGKFFLYAFKGVQSKTASGQPLVWFKVPAGELSLTTTIDWYEQFGAYVSTSKIVPQGRITASNSVNINLGQRWKVRETGAGDVLAGQTPQAVEVQNVSERQWTTGISQEIGGKQQILCAFPLYGNSLDVFAPLQRVLLMFSTEAINTGTVIFQAYSPSILIDLTADNYRAVKYHIDEGWEWGGYAWAHEYPPSTYLAPLLIEVPVHDPEPSFTRTAPVLSVRNR